MRTARMASSPAPPGPEKVSFCNRSSSGWRSPITHIWSISYSSTSRAAQPSKHFEKLPHTVGMVTDLSGRLTERALTALKSELKRREHILSRANAKKIAQYQAMRMQNPSEFEPLPNLFIVIDEFAELAKEHPTFMDGVVSVVQ